MYCIVSSRYEIEHSIQVRIINHQIGLMLKAKDDPEMICSKGSSSFHIGIFSIFIFYFGGLTNVKGPSLLRVVP